MRHWLYVSVLFSLLAPFPVVSQETDPDRVAIVRAFVAAFNEHDTGAMAEFVADDVQWLSVSGETVSLEADGKPALVTAMDGYFQSCPSCQSHLLEVISSAERVSAVEVAVWDGKDGSAEQRSLSVYEFSGRLIRRVYYFPAER